MKKKASYIEHNSLFFFFVSDNQVNELYVHTNVLLGISKNVTKNSLKHLHRCVFVRASVFSVRHLNCWALHISPQHDMGCWLTYCVYSLRCYVNSKYLTRKIYMFASAILCFWLITTFFFDKSYGSFNFFGNKCGDS